MTDGSGRQPESVRTRVLAAVARRLAQRDVAHPLRVGIDGPCGAGKSTFARDLSVALGPSGRPVVLVDSDGFHHVRRRRHRRGPTSARGYYEDAYDFDALAARVLEPLGPGGSREYAVRVHDLVSDRVVTGETRVAARDAIVLFDATFLQRGRLRTLWDEVVYLDAAQGAALERGVERDAALFGGVAAARAAHESRYMAACRLYLAEQRPRETASVLVEHTDPDAPRILRMGGGERVGQTRLIW